MDSEECVCVCVREGTGCAQRMFYIYIKKEKSVKQRRRVGERNLNGICDKVTFREISAPSPLNRKVLS